VRSAFLLLAVATVAGCRDERPAPLPPAEPAAATPAAYCEPPLPQRLEQPDRGVGVVAFSPDTPAQGVWADTMLLHARPAESSATVGRYIFCATGEHAWAFILETGAGDAVGNSLEFEYEYEGLPIDSVLPDGTWARTLYARSADGSWLRGWTPVGEQQELVFWRELLPQRPLFYSDEAEIDLRVRPGDARLDFPLVRLGAEYDRRLDYILYPDSVAGDWLRVRVVTPSDACVFPPPAVRDTTAWIRFLDADGRPLVWYFARGC
jgi:hypothetical protein